ncbi:hypothetical protein CRENBAI_019565 [Crenichthys baileyi]|uniref:Uncharacterized protein n=1 Tax=Crenichthys baileyi TaxID=28760 RepID=A0AAV9SRE1_9TELE
MVGVGPKEKTLLESSCQGGIQSRQGKLNLRRSRELQKERVKTDQADKALKLLHWTQQQGGEIRARYGEDIEIQPSALLLEEMEETFRGSRLVLAPLGYGPRQNYSSSHSPFPTSVPACEQTSTDRAEVSCRSATASFLCSKHHRRQPTAAAEPSTPALTTELSTSALAAELSTSA